MEFSGKVWRREKEGGVYNENENVWLEHVLI